jgi:ATP-dependent helicase HrpB
MSATLDGARVARLLEPAPIIESQGRAYPVRTVYLGSDPTLRLEQRVAQAAATALAQDTGDVLAFLPGQAEIRRTEALLAERRAPGVDVTPLFGALSVEDQDRAMAAAPPGRRKVVLASAIAETSLTLEGVRVVIDCGWSRTPQYDSQSGLTRLNTVRVSRAAADQRRGRAGRTAPGVCYRLWEEAETKALAPFSDPEILQGDLSGLALTLALWGRSDPAGLVFLDPPPPKAYQAATDLLKSLRALDQSGLLTPHGRRLSALSLPPRLAHMVLEGVALGRAEEAALIAAVLTERGLGGSSPDLNERVSRLASDDSPRARDAKRLARGWVRQADPSAGGLVLGGAGQLLLAAFPERFAQGRGRDGEFRLLSGRGVYLDPGEPLAQEPWLAAADLGQGGAKDRILLAAPVAMAEILQVLGDQIQTEDVLETGPGGQLRAKRLRRLGALILDAAALAVDPALLASRLVDQVRADGVKVLPWSGESLSLRARIAFARTLEGDAWPDLSDEALQSDLEAWLAPLVSQARSLSEISSAALEAALWARLGQGGRGRLERLAPARFTAPTGSSFEIDYTAEGGPQVTLRVQEVFGLTVHPLVGDGRTPLTLALTSPAHRPLQVTRDLPGFWRGSWSEVRKAMRGRYPRHPWPEDPAAAAPTARAKPKGR